MLMSSSKFLKAGMKSLGDMFDTEIIFADINMSGADRNVEATIPPAIWNVKHHYK